MSQSGRGLDSVICELTKGLYAFDPEVPIFEKMGLKDSTNEKFSLFMITLISNEGLILHTADILFKLYSASLAPGGNTSMDLLDTTI